MWREIGKFISINWLNILLVIVGVSAIFVYWMQERRKVSEAASLIVMQIKDLQKRIGEISLYISDGKINQQGFYESLILFKTDYWNKYKHYFVRKIDDYSFRNFDEFYKCASEILEQQELMKNLQKNYFFYMQQTLLQMEGNAISQALNLSNQGLVDQYNKGIDELIGISPENSQDEQKQSIKYMLKNNLNIDNQKKEEMFWNLYNREQKNIINAIDGNALTNYTPIQIRISIENALKKINTVPVFSCEGYKKIEKISKRKI